MAEPEPPAFLDTTPAEFLPGFSGRTHRMPGSKGYDTECDKCGQWARDDDGYPCQRCGVGTMIRQED